MPKPDHKKTTSGVAMAGAGAGSPFPETPGKPGVVGPLPPPPGFAMPPFGAPMFGAMPPQMPMPPMPGFAAMPSSAGGDLFQSLGNMLRLGIDALNIALAGGNQLLQGLSGTPWPYPYPHHAPHGGCHHGHHCCGGHDHGNTYHDGCCHSCCNHYGESCCNPSVHNCC